MLVARTDPKADTGVLLDEMDVERAIADDDENENENAPSVFGREIEGSDPEAARAMHVADPVVEVLDDERDIVDADLRGDTGAELEWRIATSPDRDELRGPDEPSPARPGSTRVRPEDPVGVVMATRLARIEPEVTLAELAAALTDEGVGTLAVLRGDHLEGVVSERDVVRAVAAGGDLGDVWAADVMTEAPVVVDVDEPISLVAERMLDEGVRHVPVMRDGRVVGMVSVRDVLRVLADAST
jgi:CBS domain-containing protein